MFERGKREEGTTEIGGDSGATAMRGVTSPAPRSTGDGAVIGRSIRIDGDLRGEEDLRIEGDVSGTVELRNNHLTIGKEGKVRADVYAKSIAVDGTTEGDLFASERVVVHVNAQVRGNITAPRVGIEEGARFRGSIEMDQAEVENALGKASMSSTGGPHTSTDDKRNGKGKTAPGGAEAGSEAKPPAGAP